MPPNWDDEGGASIARQALDATRHLLKVRPRLRAAYKLFPTRIGGLLVEFIVNGWDLSVEFGPDGGIELFGFEVDGDRELLPRQFTQLGSEFLEAFDKASGGKWQSD
ncbi:hypothetical protein CDN99_23685 [Roseateles aquatilis]|uniref:Uncharacterized protein n=1 Tax=Roseateles aquatilis TaxID=431061 RepID=A0A246IXE5_9BURK|nr:hypothetical protein CDN99_23685 [Roseateles aquatilis]